MVRRYFKLQTLSRRVCSSRAQGSTRESGPSNPRRLHFKGLLGLCSLPQQVFRTGGLQVWGSRTHGGFWRLLGDGSSEIQSSKKAWIRDFRVLGILDTPVLDTNATSHAEDSLDSVRHHMEGTSEVSKPTLDSPHTDALTQKPESSIWQPYFEVNPHDIHVGLAGLQVWPAARVSSTLAVYNFGSFVAPVMFRKDFELWYVLTRTRDGCEP